MPIFQIEILLSFVDFLLLLLCLYSSIVKSVYSSVCAACDASGTSCDTLALVHGFVGAVVSAGGLFGLLEDFLLGWLVGLV